MISIGSLMHTCSFLAKAGDDDAARDRRQVDGAR
jgi:hypothetical protein